MHSRLPRLARIAAAQALLVLLPALPVLAQSNTAPTPLFKSSFEPTEFAAGGVCSDFYSGEFAPSTGQVQSPVAYVARPAKGVVRRDPAFATCVVRATDHAVEPPSGFARNDYSRRQAFNVDGSRFIVYALDGFWHLYDARSLQHLRRLNGPAADAEPQWHPTDPAQLYYLPTYGGMEIRALNVESNQHTRVADFNGKLPWSDVRRAWTKSEGSPSADARYWCFQAETSDHRIRGVFTYDLQTQQVIASRSLSARPDHVSMSASGRHCVVSHLSGAGGTVAWTRDFTSSRQVHGTSEHSDLALGKDGSDYYVFVDYQSNGGDLVMVNLDTGVRTALFRTYIQGTGTAYHVSGKNFARPGWVLLSTYARSGAELWLHERVMAVELAAAPRILNLAHHQSRFNGYWTEPHATVSRDFRRVLFTSNWGSNSSQDVDAYMIGLPAGLLPE